MKRVCSCFPVLLFILQGILPLCCLIGGIIGRGAYVFTLYDPALWTFGLTLLTFAATAILLYRKGRAGSAACIFGIFLPPVTAINGICCLIYADSVWSALLSLLCCGFGIFLLFYRQEGAVALKIISAVLSFLLAALIALGSFICLCFSGFDQKTVVRRLPSPRGGYIAKVVRTDQGALGGITLVEVRENTPDIDLGFGRLAKPSSPLYTGRYGESETMQVAWRDETTLLIDGTAHAVEEKPG